MSKNGGVEMKENHFKVELNAKCVHETFDGIKQFLASKNTPPLVAITAMKLFIQIICEDMNVKEEAITIAVENRNG